MHFFVQAQSKHLFLYKVNPYILKLYNLYIWKFLCYFDVNNFILKPTLVAFEDSHLR